MPESDEKRHNDQFDVPWKDILDAYLPDFLEFFLPVAFAEIDWSRGFEFLNTEFARISRDADIGDRRMDKLIKVWQRDGKEFWVLIHIEIQGDRKTNFASGMYVFQYRAYDLYQVPVVGLAILADEEVGWRPTEFGYEMWGTKQSYQFTSVKLLDYSESGLEQSTNPFAVVTLAHLHAKKTKHLAEDRYVVKRRMIFGLYRRGFSRKQVIDLFNFIDWVMHLPKKLDDRLNAEILEHEESQKMPYISSMERFLEERGEKKGEAKMLARQLRSRFGELPTWASEKLNKAEPPFLEEWGLRILDAKSLNAVFADRT
ncbi:MAG: hypothetical protein HQL75_01985 [Magnetococcales bacterium]|nr:hypothetical protein [Magnetococcales bacterium]